MAVLTGISDAVRAGIAGAAGQAVKAGADAVRNIAGLNVEGSNSALASSIGANKRTNSTILTYPMNVDSDPQQGHYIMFMINERIPGTLKDNKTTKSFESIVQGIKEEENFKEPDSRKLTENEINAQAQDQMIVGLKAKATKIAPTLAPDQTNRRLSQGRQAFNKNVATISLYMPPAVSVTYDIKYADKEIGTFAALGVGVLDAFRASSGVSDTLTNITKSLTGATGKEGLINMANKAVDTIAPGALALSQLESGTVVTPRMEMMFEGVGRRSFSYTFSFLPKSVQEARLVEDIIYHFKFHAMPKYSNPTTRREMNIPGTFDIRYMYKGNQNSFINKVSECFLTNVAVEYGADRFTAYEETTGKRGKGSPPQKSKLTLQFTELEVLSQDHIKLGH
jgi:hypothetical protein